MAEAMSGVFRGNDVPKHEGCNCHEDASGQRLARFKKIFISLIHDSHKICQIPAS